MAGGRDLAFPVCHSNLRRNAVEAAKTLKIEPQRSLGSLRIRSPNSYDGSISESPAVFKWAAVSRPLALEAEARPQGLTSGQQFSIQNPKTETQVW